MSNFLMQTYLIALPIMLTSILGYVVWLLKEQKKDRDENSKRTDTKDIEDRVKENTRINVKLDNITQTTQEIKSEISSMREDIKSHNDRLIKLEESVKSAHHRIDGVVERLNGGNSHE